MGKGKKQGSAYDYANSTMSKSVSLPPKLKCSRCDKYKGHGTFSETQLNRARTSISNHNNYEIRCIPCNPGPVVEIECSFCSKTKGVEHFAKSQRAKDNAKCYKCTEDQLATDPVDEQRYEDARDAFEPAEKSENNWPDYWREGTVTNSEAGDYDDARSDDGEGGGISLFRNFRKPAIQSGTLIESDDAYSTGSRVVGGSSDTRHSKGGPIKLGGGDWTVAPEKSWNTKSAARSGDPGFQPNRDGNPQSRAGLSSSVSGTAHTFNSNFTDQPAAGGWAKIKAYKPQKPEEHQEPEGTVDWESESEADSDDSDDSDGEI